MGLICFCNRDLNDAGVLLSHSNFFGLFIIALYFFILIIKSVCKCSYTTVIVIQATVIQTELSFLAEMVYSVQ